jgi:hypothetical protein
MAWNQACHLQVGGLRKAHHQFTGLACSHGDGGACAMAVVGILA